MRPRVRESRAASSSSWTRTKKLLQIANQDFEDLKKHPGVLVTLTGELKGDTITVTKIELAPTK